MRREVHHQERHIVQNVDPAQAWVEFDAVEGSYVAIQEDNVAQMKVSMVRAHDHPHRVSPITL